MIKQITGDLIKSAKQGNFDVIAHQANCFNTMGSGIAKSIREEWPEAAAVDSATIKGDHSKLGTLTHTKNTSPIIVNLYGQFDYWSQGVLTNYDALEKALLEMKSKFPNKRIGLPKIGALRARGDWNTIFAIIKKVFCDDSDDVTIVEWEQTDVKNQIAKAHKNSTNSSIISSLSAFSSPAPLQIPKSQISNNVQSNILSSNLTLVKTKFHGKRKCKVCNIYHPIKEMNNYLPSVWVCKKNRVTLIPDCNDIFISKTLVINNLKNDTTVMTKKFHGKRKCKECNTYHPIKEMNNYLPSAWVCKQTCNNNFVNKICRINNVVDLNAFVVSA